MTARAARIQGILPTVSFDVVCVLSAVLVPTLAHMTEIPLYYIEPIRILTLLGCVYTNRLNAILLTVVMATSSTVLTGHPVGVKSAIISIELIANSLAFTWLAARSWQSWVAALCSIIASKAIYYSLKYTALSIDWLQGSLISTPITVQLFSTLLSVLIVAGVTKRNDAFR